MINSLAAVTEFPNGRVSRPVRVGVLGCGYWGPKLARNFHELGDSELALVCDELEERLTQMKTLYPDVRTSRGFGELLKSDLDAVAIATPVNTHYPLARAALEAGKHVLVEKPFTSSSAHAIDLIRRADRKGLTLMVGHTFEYNPAVLAVRQIVESGELGTIYYISCTRVSLGLFQPDINVVWDLAPHDISILNYVLGSEPALASARGGTYVRPGTGLHEVAYVTLHYPGRVLANLRVSWLDPVKTRQITIVGSKKMLVYDDIAANKVIIYDQGAEVPPYTHTEEEFRMSYRHGSETVYPITWVEPLRAECQHFLDCIRSGAVPRTGGEVGLKVVRTLEAAQKSLLNGGVGVAVE